MTNQAPSRRRLPSPPKERLADFLSHDLSLQELLMLRPEDAEAFSFLASELAEEGALADAETAAWLATECAPKSFVAWVTLGAVLARLSEERRALAAYAQAATLASTEVDQARRSSQLAKVFCDVAELRLSLLDYASAAQALDLALKADPEGKTPFGARAQYLVAKTLAHLRERA